MKYLILILLFSLSSCSSPISNLSTQIEQKLEKPIDKIIKDNEPSFDENEQNSGIVDFVKDKGWIITPNAAKRYNTLIEKYGKDFTPQIEKDFGLTQDGKFFILTQQAMIKFAILNQKYKSK